MHEKSYYEAQAMKPIQFDSLEYFNKLRAADVPDAQAQAQAQALQKVLEDALVSHMSDLATKSDLRSEIALVRKDMDALQNTLVIKLSVVLASMLAFVELVHRVF